MIDYIALALPGLIIDSSPQGSEEWLAARVGVVTGSRARDAISRLKDAPEKVDKKTGEITPAKRGGPTEKSTLYAMDIARELVGGRVASPYVNAAMRTGQTEEANARLEYELRTGALVEEVGFIYTEDRKFGVSSDGLLFSGGQRGAIEIKTMVSSGSLFNAMVTGDVGDYIDQCVMQIWLLHLDWIDLVLWAPDLPGAANMKVIRIERDEAQVDALVKELLLFRARAERYAEQLLSYIAADASAEPTLDEPRPATAPSATTADIDSLFA